MASKKDGVNQMIAYTINKQDFPEKFDEFKLVIDTYIEFSSPLSKNPQLSDFWLFKHAVSEIPYYVDDSSYWLLDLIDKRAQALLAKIEHNDSIINILFKDRLITFLRSALIEKKILPTNIKFEDLPWGGELPIHKEVIFFAPPEN